MSKRISPVFKLYTRKIERLARAYVRQGMSPTVAKTKAAAQVRAEIRSLDWLRAYAEEKDGILLLRCDADNGSKS